MFSWIILGWASCGLLAFLLDFDLICKDMDEVREEMEEEWTPGKERLGLFVLALISILEGPFTLYQVLKLKLLGVREDD